MAQECSELGWSCWNQMATQVQGQGPSEPSHAGVGDLSKANQVEKVQEHSEVWSPAKGHLRITYDSMTSTLNIHPTPSSNNTEESVLDIFHLPLQGPSHHPPPSCVPRTRQVWPPAHVLQVWEHVAMQNPALLLQHWFGSLPFNKTCRWFWCRPKSHIHWTSSTGALALRVQVGFINAKAPAQDEREEVHELRLLVLWASHLHGHIRLHKRCPLLLASQQDMVLWVLVTGLVPPVFRSRGGNGPVSTLEVLCYPCGFLTPCPRLCK